MMVSTSALEMALFGIFRHLQCKPREAIAFAVAFAPEACRNEPMHGLVLLSLADGTTRFGIGAGVWRWSDLLGVR